MAREYNIDLPYNAPDLLYSGLYEAETWKDEHEEQGDTYIEKFEDQEFY